LLRGWIPYPYAPFEAHVVVKQTLLVHLSTRRDG
jgi:hypothetical protein